MAGFYEYVSPDTVKTTVYVSDFQGDGTTTSFTLTANPFSENNTQVYIDGVYQEKTGYSVLGTVLTFSQAPPNLSGIEVTMLAAEEIQIGTTSADLVSYTPAGAGAVVTDVQTELRKQSASDGTVYTPAGTGAVATTVQAKLRESVSVKDFGAVGDGTTDDTAAIQAALDTGLTVYIPPTANYYAVNNTLSVTTAGQKVFGDGLLSKVIQTGINANSNVFQLSGVNGVSFEGIYAIPGTTTTSVIYGWAFASFGSDYTTIRNCTVSGHRRGGIMLHSSNHCQVRGNTIRDSIVNPAIDQHDNTGIDIAILYGSSCNTIDGNIITSGSGVGIGVQTITINDKCDFNTISNNTIKQSKMYGVMLYKLNSADTVEHNVVTGNTIDTVYGNVEHTTNGFIYGTGIYVQGAEYSVISDNNVYNVCVNTVEATLTQAGVGVTNCTNVTITGNTIRDSAWDGIDLFDPNTLGIANGTAVILGNHIDSPSKAGIYAKDFPNAIITGNNIKDTGGQGVLILDAVTTNTNSILVSSNIIDNSGHTGLDIANASYTGVTGNTVSNCAVHGIVIYHGYFNITGNTVEGNSSSGIRTQSTVTDGVISSNVVDGNVYNINLNGKALLDKNIVVNGVTNDYLGAYAPVISFVDGDLTPDVSNGKYFKTVNTGATSITTFDGGYATQEIIIRTTDANTTLIDGVSLQLAGSVNYAMAATDIIYLYTEDGANWKEISRTAP